MVSVESLPVNIPSQEDFSLHLPSINVPRLSCMKLVFTVVESDFLRREQSKANIKHVRSASKVESMDNYFDECKAV